MDRRSNMERLRDWAIRSTARLAGFIALWVILAIIFSFAHTLTAFWRGVEPTTQDIADDWIWRAAGGGFFTARSPELHRAIRWGATLVILVEWIIFSFTTVFIIAVIF